MCQYIAPEFELAPFDTIPRDFNLSTEFLFVNVDLFLHVDKFGKPLQFSRSRNFRIICL